MAADGLFNRKTAILCSEIKIKKTPQSIVCEKDVFGFDSKVAAGKSHD